MENLPSPNITRENDVHLKEYIDFKEKFEKIEIHLGIKTSKTDTNYFCKILKPIRIPYKNYNPVFKTNDSPDNIYITKYDQDEKTELNKYIDSHMSEKDKAKYKYEIVTHKVKLTSNNYSYDDTLKIIFKDKINSNNIPGGFEIVGKIAHLNLREEFLEFKYAIGQLILDKNPNIRTVVNKVSKIDNVFRTYDMEVLAGVNDFNVEHREGNILFKFNLKNTYWCSRLQGERDRLVKIMKKGECLCDAFCGVGPLSLRACKKGLRVLANDLNPSCYEYINNNIKINKLNEKMITTFNMDAREFIRICIEKSYKIIDNSEDNLDNKFPIDLHIDHIYMNLPKDAIEFLDVFIGLFKGCKDSVYGKNNLPIIHVYGFAKTGENDDPIMELKKRIAAAFKMDYNTFIKECDKDILNIERVRDISTKKVVFCIDMKVPYCVGYKTIHK